MQEVIRAVRALLEGKTVSVDGDHVTLVDARLTEPQPRQESVPLLVGGNGSKLLGYAAATADIVGVAGLARTLADGHTHEVDWSMPALDRTFDLIALTARSAGRTPEVEALVQHVEITADAEASAAAIAEWIVGAGPSELLAAPFVWIGTVEEIADQLRSHRNRWGVTRYVVRQDAIEPARNVLGALRS